MKTNLVIIVGFLLCAGAMFGGMVYFARNTQFTAETKTLNPDSFKLSNDRMLSDLQNRSVVIQPIGQIWSFTPDQRIIIEVLQTKGSEDGVIVTVKMTSNATVTPPATPAPTTTVATPGTIGNSAPAPVAPVLPVNVTLYGVAKLQYELISGEWYLVDVISVNLKAMQR